MVNRPPNIFLHERHYLKFGAICMLREAVIGVYAGLVR